jgi:uncharacterized membrane protein YfcA
MPHLTFPQWILAAAAAFGLGAGKGGLAGLSLFHVTVFAFLFGARDSSGIVLPMLVVGDVGAVATYRRHARWDYIWRMLPPCIAGILAGAVLMQRLSDAAFKPVVGWIILLLTVLQVMQMRWPHWFGGVPHARWFAWSIGLLAGVTTMLANAAGPIIALYALSVSLPKYEYVGTSAWLFMIVNALKVPFSAALGLIRPDTLQLNLVLLPMVLAGLATGRWLIQRIPQRAFDLFLLTFAGVAALRLIGIV